MKPAPPAQGGGAELGEELSDYQAGRNRKLQVTKRGWNRFTREKKAIFLRWFAATCNAKLAARRAGVGYSTVYDHRMDDPRFAEGWDVALEQGYAHLEAKLLEMQFEQMAGETIGFADSATPPLPAHAAHESLSPAQGGGAEADIPDLELRDPEMAMQLLKLHKAEVMRIRAERERRENPRARGRMKALPTYERERLASDAEVRRALVKGLAAFGVRVTAEQEERVRRALSGE